HDIRRPAIHFFLTACAPEALDLSDGHALDPDFAERVLHFVQLERLDDRFHLFHLSLLASAAPSRPWWGDLAWLPWLGWRSACARIEGCARVELRAASSASFQSL